MALELIDRRCVVGHEDEGFHAGPRGVGGQRSARVARRGNCQSGDAELFCHGDRHRQSTTLETAGGQSRFVLDPQVGQAKACPQFWALHQRRHRFSERDDFVDIGVGQQFPITPQGVRPAGQVRLGDRTACGVQIITDPQRAILVQCLGPVGGQPRAIQGTFQMGNETAHRDCSGYGFLATKKTVRTAIAAPKFARINRAIPLTLPENERLLKSTNAVGRQDTTSR